MDSIQRFDLTKKHPQVLFIGNGLTRENGFSWHEFIKKCSREDCDVGKYKRGEGDDYFQIPNTVLSLAVMDKDDTKRHRRYMDQLNEVQYRPNEIMEQLVHLPLDSILTTNYTYEIEYAIKNSYPNLKEESKKKYATAFQADSKYLIHTCNTFEGYPPIWHIHGEARRKSSLILSHDEYARMIHKIIEYCNQRKDDYTVYNQDVHMKSWVDYFILGDIYILGLGFDFAEFDLWWLINRRIRENASIGRIFFYEPEREDNKYKLLAMKDMGIKVESFGMRISQEDMDKNAKYQEFYRKAIESIAIRTTGKKS